MSHNQDTTTTTVVQNTPTTVTQNPTTTVVVTLPSNQNDPTTTVEVQNPSTTIQPSICVDQNGQRISCDVLTVAETVGGSSGELPATGADTGLLGGAALAFIAVGVILARVVRREPKGLGR